MVLVDCKVFETTLKGTINRTTFDTYFHKTQTEVYKDKIDLPESLIEE